MKSFFARLFRSTFTTALDASLLVASDRVKTKLNKKRSLSELERELIFTAMDALVEEIRAEVQTRLGS